MYIAVGIGGMVGALLRYSVSLMTFDMWSETFPLATFLANIIGSFLLSFLTMHLFRLGKLQSQLTTAIGTGMIGSFTTFSTFSVETMLLLQNGEAGWALIYVIGSISGGLLAAYIGSLTGNRLFLRFTEQEEKA